MRKDQLQLLAATCLHIASKIEDDVPIDVTNLFYSADKTFEKEDIVELEVRVLKLLDFYLFPTIHDFVGLYHQYLGIVDKTCFWLSHYLSEVALQSDLYLKYPPSLLAASVVALSRHWTGFGCLAELESLSGYMFCELGECIVSIAMHSNDDNPDLKVIANRYMKPRRGGVAALEFPIPELEVMKSNINGLTDTI